MDIPAKSGPVAGAGPSSGAGRIRALALRAGSAALLVAAAGCGDRGARAAVVSDVGTGDEAHPSELRPVTFGPPGAELSGRMFVAKGVGPHPTLLLLHDVPAIELNHDIAHAARRAGWNVLTVRYRSAGDAAPRRSRRHDAGREPTAEPAATDVGRELDTDSVLEHVMDDARAALRYLRARSTAARHRVDDERIALLGHGLGGAAALRMTARDSALAAAGTMALKLPSEGGRGTARLRRLAPRLARRPVLLVAAARTPTGPSSAEGGAAPDDAGPRLESHATLVEAFRRNGPWLLSHRVLETGPKFVDRRIELATVVVGWLRAVDRGWVRSTRID